MKLALRLQRGEAFGPGEPISKFVLLDTRASKPKINPPVSKRIPIAIPKPENANLIENSLRLQPGEAFGPGGPNSKLMLLESCVYKGLEFKNLPTRYNMQSTLDPEA